jgi:hypothetical protein
MKGESFARPVAPVILALLAQLLPVRSARLAAVHSRPRAPSGRPHADAPESTADANATAVMTVSSGAAREKTRAGKSLFPIFWLHVPKTGSSFATTLAHFGCPSLPAGVVTEKPDDLFSTYPQLWMGCQRSFKHFEIGHDPLPKSVDRRHVVSVFREPKARLASGYFHNLHDCPSLRNSVCIPRYHPQMPKGFPDWNGLPGDCDRFFQTPLQQQKPTILEYSRCVGGCATHMLTGTPCGFKPGTITTAAEADSKAKALKAIEQLGFVGLTEQWPLSVCLFHMRFGGNCLRASFTNVRPGNHTHEYDNIYGVIDFDMGTDQAIYDAATKRFWREIHENDVSLARCRQDICPSAAEYFQERLNFLIVRDEETDDI